MGIWAGLSRCPFLGHRLTLLPFRTGNRKALSPRIHLSPIWLLLLAVVLPDSVAPPSRASGRQGWSLGRLICSGTYHTQTTVPFCAHQLPVPTGSSECPALSAIITSPYGAETQALSHRDGAQGCSFKEQAGAPSATREKASRGPAGCWESSLAPWKTPYSHPDITPKGLWLGATN